MSAQYSNNSRRHRGASSPSPAFAAAASLVLLLLLGAGSAAGQAISGAQITLPRYVGGGATEAYYSLDLGSGRTARLDQLRRNPEQIRLRRLETNLFQEIGRPAAPGAQPGELLLLPIRGSDGSTQAALFVESSTGYTAFLEDLGRGDKLGKLITTIGRPFGPLANADLNFVLLGRRDGSGRTQGAYLYHGTTGKGLYISALQDLAPDTQIVATSELPTSTGYVTAAPITVQEQTVSYLIIDSGTGELFFLEPSGRAGNLRQVTTPLKLFEEFDDENLNPAPRRFVPVALQDDEQTTTRVLIIDVGSGQLALLDGLRGPTPRLGFTTHNVYSVIAGGRQEQVRHFETVPGDTSGGTRGVWVLDSLSGSSVYIENPGDPGSLRIQSASVSR